MESSVFRIDMNKFLVWPVSKNYLLKIKIKNKSSTHPFFFF